MLTDIKNHWLFISLATVFMAVEMFFIIQGFYWFALFPLILVLFGVYLISWDKVFFLIVALTPFSFSLRDFDLQLGVILPTEPLLFGLLLLFLLKLLAGERYDQRIFKHPISISVSLVLLCLIVSSIFSVRPLVSVKYLVAQFWFIVPAFFMAAVVFKNIKNLYRFVWLFLLPLCVTIIIITFQHAAHGFDRQVGVWITYPFFNDHTLYGAVIAMFVPVTIWFIFDRAHAKYQRVLSFICLLILLMGLYFSFSRAAWLSVFLSGFIFLILFFRISPRMLFIGSVLTVFLAIASYQSIIKLMEENEQESSENFTEHVQSMTNITSDASNMERINRWKAALKMYPKYPIMGWGPGTYQFEYAPYQKSWDLTIISTNAGDGGNAHSEYISRLVESGIIAAIAFVLLLVFTVLTSLKLYKRTLDSRLRYFSLSIFLGLISYFAHAGLNNFLDTDKISMPFWGFLAMLVVIDLYHSGDKTEKLNKYKKKSL